MLSLTRSGRVVPLLLVAAVAVGAPHRAASAADPPPAEPRLTVVTSSAHCDWTWGHTRAWHADRYAEIIRQVLLLMRKYPRYVWQLENVNEQLSPFLAKAQQAWPELIGEFWQRVREGRIEVIVAYSDPRLSEIYPETTVRNLVLGKQCFRRHAPGLQQPVYHAVDLMVGHSQMPQLLAQAGYRYFLFSRPSQQKRMFWRTGLDGTRMLCALQHYGYGGLTANGVALESHSGDDILPAEKLAEAAETWDPAKKVLATSARFFEEVERAGGPLPELQGVLDSLESFCCGMGLHGNRNLYTWNNQHEDLLVSLEKAQVMAAMAGGKPSAPAAPAAADGLWQDLLSCVGHAILWSWQADYDERLQKAQATRTAGEQSLQTALAAVAARVGRRDQRGEPLLVFNFHAWPVTGPVEFVLAGAAADVTLRDGGGRRVPLQVVDPATPGGCRLAFVADDVPAGGYRTYYLAPARHDAAHATPPPAGEPADPAPVHPALQAGGGPIENERFRVQWTADGKLQVFDKQRGGPAGAAAGGLGDVVLYDTPRPTDWMMNGPLGARHAAECPPAGCQFFQGPAFAALRSTGTIGPHTVTREVRLWRGSRRLDFHVAIDAAEGCGVFYIRFPLGTAGRVFAGIPFGAEPREELDREPLRGEYFAQGYPEAYYATRWTDVSGAGGGYTFVAPHGMHNGYAYRAQEQALEFALLRVRPMPQGAWGQVHPSLQGTGHHRWHCALVPHPGPWQEAATYRDAFELHTPLLAFSPAAGIGRAGLPQGAPSDAAPPAGDATAKTVAAGPAGPASRLEDAASFVEVQPAPVVLSAFRCVAAGPDGRRPAWELRLYETVGRPADAVVRLAVPIGQVQETNLLGEPVAAPRPVAVSGNEIRLRLPPWKIVTLRITPGVVMGPR